LLSADLALGDGVDGDALRSTFSTGTESRAKRSYWLPPRMEGSREAGGVGRPCPQFQSALCDELRGMPPWEEENSFFWSEPEREKDGD
jgi:hypothetical protein